jgi:protocatechuate 3,4-dioxygenase beta subunit
MDHQISRRTALAGAGVGLTVLLAACGRSGDPTSSSTTSTQVPTSDGGTATVQPQTTSTPATADLFDDSATCTLTPEETEGPYYFEVDAIRSDIREDRDGTTLRLAVRVQDATCEPISGAAVDIWHCDAEGVYSGFESASTGGGAGGSRTDEETYLRGVQVTNSEGIVEFLTVYPGWYRGRTVHIHAKVHLDSQTLLTTQFFFDEAVTDAVYAGVPYSQAGSRDTYNNSDSIYDDQTLLTLHEDGDGYLGLITVGVAES